MKFGIIVFPGSNCDHDCYHVIKHVFGQPVEYVWHKSDTLDGFDCIVLPGGFSYGDYLRTGAIARFSPVMEAVVKFAEAGGIVIGICNGFQVLTEVGLLPGVLMRNRELKFICETVSLSVDNTATRFTSEYSGEETVSIPIAHADGSYYADAETIKELEDSSRVLFRYATPEGVATEEANPNGSVNSIAGIMNAEGNVMGMMPHPERACENELGSTDGRGLFESVINSLVAG
jgi:phosphoribosylformylglycinamidine synthase